MPLPISATRSNNDFNDKVDPFVQRAVADEHATIHSFGDTWGPEPKANVYFAFKPGQGIPGDQTRQPGRTIPFQQ